jgi:hypothetical protein
MRRNPEDEEPDQRHRVDAGIKIESLVTRRHSRTTAPVDSLHGVQHEARDEG